MLPARRPAILLVDDDLAILSVVARRLSREGYDVQTAASGPAALEALKRSWPNLLVIDLMMPHMDGGELARRIKRTADLPIIVLSAVGESESKVAALEAYAEDYITKPFDPDELVARVSRVLRRSGDRRAVVTLNSGDLEIDLASRQVTTTAGSFALTPTETRVLQVLVSSLDRAVTTEVLLDRAWSEADGADPSYVWVTIRRLRRKLEMDPDKPRYLLTERGAGYRLISAPSTA